jgi:hypothetical protein
VRGSAAGLGVLQQVLVLLLLLSRLLLLLPRQLILLLLLLLFLLPLLVLSSRELGKDPTKILAQRASSLESALAS